MTLTNGNTEQQPDLQLPQCENALKRFDFLHFLKKNSQLSLLVCYLMVNRCLLYSNLFYMAWVPPLKVT